MIFVFVSGRGIENDSRQHLLFNEYDLEKKFYKMVDIEYCLQFIAKKQKNAYIIGVFSIGRRVFDPKKHTGFLTKEDAALRKLLFKEIEDEKLQEITEVKEFLESAKIK